LQVSGTSSLWRNILLTAAELLSETLKLFPSETLKLILSETLKLFLSETLKLILSETLKLFLSETLKLILSETLKLILSETLKLILSETLKLILSETLKLFLSETLKLILSETLKLILSETLKLFLSETLKLILSETLKLILSETLKLILSETLKLFLSETLKLILSETLKLILSETLKLFLSETLKLILSETLKLILSETLKLILPPERTPSLETLCRNTKTHSGSLQEDFRQMNSDEKIYVSEILLWPEDRRGNGVFGKCDASYDAHSLQVSSLTEQQECEALINLKDQNQTGPSSLTLTSRSPETQQHLTDSVQILWAELDDERLLSMFLQHVHPFHAFWFHLSNEDDLMVARPLCWDVSETQYLLNQDTKQQNHHLGLQPPSANQRQGQGHMVLNASPLLT
ncbi:RE1-silencing transcription factor, partial [Dissostichus eleginoides]